MKMVKHTVEIMEAWLDEDLDAGDVISVSTGDGASDDEDDTIQVKILGLHMILCPGVQDFGGEDVPNEDIANDIKTFVIENGGDTVEELSFYTHRVTGLDGEDAKYTERMERWSWAVTNVTSWTNVDNGGSNDCLDIVIDENMLFTVKGDERILEVNAKLSNMEGMQILQELGYEKKDMEQCIWYMTHALALNPMVCSVEPRTRVRTLCKDGSTDLSKCTGGSSGGDNISTPNATTGSAGTRWKRNFASFMTLLAVLLGGAIL